MLDMPTFTEIAGAGQWAGFLPIQPGVTHTDRHHFDTVEQAARWGNEVVGWHTAARDTGGNKPAWTGSPSLPAALKTLEDGWPEGRERVALIRDRIETARAEARRIIKHDVAGAVPDVARFLAGAPDCMRRSALTTKARAITLISDMGANCNIEPTAMQNRAGVVAAIVDRIEEAGFRVELLVGFRLQAGTKNAEVVAGAKSAGDALDVGCAAFALGHPSFFRRIGFAIVSRDARTKYLGFGLGSPASIPSSGERVQDANAAGAYVLAGLQNSPDAFKTEERAATQGLQMILASLRAQGCPGIA